MLRYQVLLMCMCVLGLAGWTGAVSVRVLATGDMHGYLQSESVEGQKLGGAAEMTAYWKRNEGYDPKQCLVLGCGDANSGSAISTLFKGDPIVMVMDLMGYDACALGEHEFDYGRAQMAAWKDLADFPYLAANLKTADGGACDVAAPFAIIEKQGVKFGIIGLISKDLRELTDNAEGLKVIPYADALREAALAARKAGAQVLIVVAHVPQHELVEVAKDTQELNIPLLLGGASHEVALNKVGGAWVVSSGQNWQSYARVTLEVTAATGKVEVQQAQVVWLKQAQPELDKAVAGGVSAWQQKMDAMMNTQVGASVAGLLRPHALYNFVDDSTLAGDPKATICLTNYGALQQDLPAGPCTIGHIFAAMPFTDSIYRVSLTGAQLVAYMHEGGNAKFGLAGLRVQNEQYTLTKTGQPLDPDATYGVLLNNYMYDNSPALQAADPLPTTVFADWRQPLYDWLAKHPTGAEKPLEKQVDVEPRMGL